MAHELDMTGGIARAAFAREPAWHGLGTVVPQEMTVEEGIELAGLSWEVECQPIYTKEGDTVREIPDKRAIIRDDSKACLGVVSTGWTPVQNRGVADFIKEVTNNGAKLAACGSLRGGKRVWFLLDLRQTYEPIKGDPVENYLVFGNGHDGLTRFRGLATGTRVVCSNTWAAAFDGLNERKGISFRHDGTIMDQVGRAKGYIESLFKTTAKRKDEAEALAKMVKMSDDKMGKFFVKMLKRHQVKEEKEVKKALDQLAMFGASETNTKGGMAGTGWGVFQTWSEYLDYRPSVRGARAARWESNLFGDYSRLKSEAWQDLLTLAK